MPFTQICLIVSLVFAIIYCWPTWSAQVLIWRPTAFGVSWLFFIIWLVLGHGGINLHS